MMQEFTRSQLLSKTRELYPVLAQLDDAHLLEALFKSWPALQRHMVDDSPVGMGDVKRAEQPALHPQRVMTPPVGINAAPQQVSYRPAPIPRQLPDSPSALPESLPAMQLEERPSTRVPQPSQPVRGYPPPMTVSASEPASAFRVEPQRSAIPSQLETRGNDRLAKIMELRGMTPPPTMPPRMPPPQAPDVPAPSPVLQPEQQEMDRLNALIDARMQPQKPKSPWATIAQGAMAGLAYGAKAPEMQMAQQQQARQATQDRVARLKEIQGGIQQRTENQQRDTQLAQTKAYQDSQIAETQRLRETQEAAEKRQEAAANADEYASGPQGIYSRKTGTVKTPAPANAASDPFDLWHAQNPNAPVADYYKLIKPDKPPTEPGTYMELKDNAGRVVSAWNPKSGEFKAAPQEGLRSSGVPAATNQKIAEYENAARKIVDLGTAYRPEFVGPTRGAWERSKASGVFSYLPFLTTPEGYGEFAALNADIKNSVIKLVTGAQMGQQEAQRILQQVPTEVDKPEIWAAKYDQTKKNADFLLSKVKELSGAETSRDAAKTGGLPNVGDTFNGAKVLKVTPIK